MASEQPINASNIVKLANERFGTKETVLHYVRLAKNAGERAKMAASIPNAVMMGAELQIMNDAVNTVFNILSNEKNALPQEKDVA